MTTTSLQEYLTEIERLLENEQYEAVVGHGFHILKQFPRHVDTYRLLAKGLLGLNRNDEARELFQRILSTDPNDLIAHIALSDLAQADNKSDEAQYHLERALELDPYNSAIQEELNRYYETDEFGLGRIQLNEGGLAHLYMRGERYGQATAVLGHLISQDKNRIDLEVLLAEALWWEGNRVEAAELSLKILDSLPNCIMANAVLTDIWFGSDRIGDAKKKARNLQAMVLADKKSVDPESIVGAALKANQAPALPELIQIEALESISSADIAASMQEIKPQADSSEEDVESEPGDMFDWLSGVVKPSAEQRMAEVLEPDSWPAGEGDVESDWFSDDAIEETAVSSLPVAETDLSAELGSNPDLFAEANDSFDEFLEPDDLADEFALKFNEQADEDATVPDWIATANSETSQLPSASDQDSFFDSNNDSEVPEWLSQAASEDFEPVQLDPLTASQWLIDDEQANDDDEDQGLPEGVKDTQDWMANLSQEFSEIVEEEDAQPAEWLREESSSNEDDLTIDDWFAELTESQINNDPLTSESSETADGEDWLDEDDWIFDSVADNQLVPSTATENMQELAPTMNNEEPSNDKENPKSEENDKKKDPLLESDADDWLAQLTQDSSNDEDDDWLAEFTNEPPIDEKPSDQEVQEPDSVENFLAELQDESNVASPEDENLEDINQWLEDLSTGEETPQEDWLSGLVDDESEIEQDASFTDWLNQAVADEESAESELNFDLSGAEEVEELSQSEDLPSLTDALDETDLEEPPDFDWLGDESGLTDLLSETEIDKEADVSETTSSDTDWLGDDTGLTDLLSDAGLGLDSSEVDEAVESDGESFEAPSLTDLLDEDGNDDLDFESDEDSFEAPSLTALLGGDDSDLATDTQQPEADWLGDDTGLTDLLSEAGLDDVEPAESESPDSDWLSEGTGLTDLLSDADLGLDSDAELDGLADADEEAFEAPSLTDLLGEDEADLDDGTNQPDASRFEDDTGLTDLLSEVGFGEDVEAAESESPDSDWLDDGTGLTDLLSDADLGLDSDAELGGLVDADEEAFEAPSLTDLLGEEDEAKIELESDEESFDAQGLTDLLESDADAQSHTDVQDDGTGLTDLLSDVGFGDDTDSTDSEASDIDWLNDESGLTDLLSDAGLDSDNESDVLSEVDDEPFDAPSLTDLLGDEGETEVALEPEEEAFDAPGLTDLLGGEGDSELDDAGKSEVEWQNDESSLTDLLSDAGLDDEADVSESVSDIESSEIFAEAGLTDLLGEIEPSEEDELGDDPETAWLDDETGLTDLLSDVGLGLDEEDDSTAVSSTDLEQTSSSDVSSSVDSGNDNESVFDEAPNLEDLLSEDGDWETADDADDSSEDALDLIDTNLPDWLSPESAEAEPAVDIPDWINPPTESDADSGSGLSEELESFLAEEPAEADEDETVSQTGLLRKIDDISTIKATAEEKEQAEIEAAKPFEPEMPDYLTSADDTAWLNQLAGNESSNDDIESSLDWMGKAESEANLDWLDSEPLPESVDEPEPEPADDEEEFDEPDSVQTPGDLDDAMSWLEDLAAEQQKPIEPLPTVAEVLDEDSTLISEEDDNLLERLLEEPDSEIESQFETEEDNVPEAPIVEAEELDSDDSTDQELADALAEIDDAMAWLDDLGEEADDLTEVQEALSTVETIDGPEVAIEEPETVVADEETLSEDDVPDDIDDAMAWLEQLAAKQGAPIEELPSLSEEETAVFEPDSFAEDEEDDLVADDAQKDPPPNQLSEALDWLEEVVSADDSHSESALVESVPKTTTAELSDTLDWLEEVATQKPIEETGDVVESSAMADQMDDDLSQADATPIEESTGEQSLSDFFDMPEDPDAALAWLNADSESEIVASEPISEEETAVEPPVAELESDDEPVAEVTSESETEEVTADDLLAGIFDIPDDPDEAMAWLEEVADEEPETAVEQIPDEQSEPVIESISIDDDAIDTSESDEVIEIEVDAQKETEQVEVDEAIELEADELGDDFLATVPEDQDEAMAWLEQLAARQGAPLEELPTVDEPVDDADVPNWIKADATTQSEDADEAPDSPSLEAQSDDKSDSEVLDELPEGLPDWFSLDDVADNEDELPSQTDWLESVPEFGDSDWLSSESEASSIVSESIDVLPDTGPLFESTSGQSPEPDLEPLLNETEPLADDEPMINDEPDSSVYQVDSDQLQESKVAIADGRFDSAASTLQTMVAEGNGLMMLIGELEVIADENPKQPTFRRLLGDAYMRNGQLQKALTTYRNALDQL